MNEFLEIKLRKIIKDNSIIEEGDDEHNKYIIYNIEHLLIDLHKLINDIK